MSFSDQMADVRDQVLEVRDQVNFCTTVVEQHTKEDSRRFRTLEEADKSLGERLAKVDRKVTWMLGGLAVIAALAGAAPLLAKWAVESTLIEHGFLHK